MEEKEPKIYRYNDDICFRQCDLANEGNNLSKGDCTCFYAKEENWKTHYFCEQYGIHLHCSKHTGIELKISKSYSSVILKCPKCDKDIEVNSLDEILKDCLKLLNMPKFQDAKLIRLDDWYIPEIKDKIKTETDYWIKTEVKTDRDGDTVVVLYVGKKDSKGKAQIFIKPEKLQLTSDHKDLDPATVLSKIEVTLKDRKLKQEYE